MVGGGKVGSRERFSGKPQALLCWQSHPCLLPLHPSDCTLPPHHVLLSHTHTHTAAPSSLPDWEFQAKAWGLMGAKLLPNFSVFRVHRSQAFSI